MENFFITLLNLSITASYLIIAVILLRFALFKAPKWINCALWALVGVRLALPFSFESILSLIPSAEPIPEDIMLSPAPQINTGIEYVNSAINPVILENFTPEPTASANTLQIIVPIAAIVWLVGVAAMLIWGIISYLRLRKKVAPSLLVRENIYFCDNITSPFILGIFKPRIYLPSTITDGEMQHVIAHENAHLCRRDHIWKPLGFLVLSVYWFNPLCWVAYILFCRDVEKACDEKAIAKMDGGERREYSSALLSCSVRQFGISACPLAFGEVGVKSRVKSVLNYKKPAFWIIVVSIVAAIAVAVAFLTMPPSDLADDIVQNLGNTDPDKMTERQKELYEKYPEYFGLDASNGLDVYVWQMAASSYSFGLKPHSDEPLGFTSTELYKLRGAAAYEMREILNSYDISRDEITIVPWQNPFSSYIPDIWIIIEGEDAVAERKAYIALVEDYLFDGIYRDEDGHLRPDPDDPSTLDYPYYDTMVFVVDGDGADEVCTLVHGVTSGLFSFIFNADDLLGNEKYSTAIYSLVYDLSFKVCDDGVVRVQGIDQVGDVHLFDITVKGGEIWLYDSETGKYIGDAFVAPIKSDVTYTVEQYVDFESKDLSKIDKIVITDGVSGADVEITNAEDISTIIGAVKTIEGKDPISNRGFYGVTYHVALYRGETEYLSFSLCPDYDDVYLLYGLYETKDGHDYPCRYTLTNCSYEDIASVLSEFFADN